MQNSPIFIPSIQTIFLFKNSYLYTLISFRELVKEQQMARIHLLPLLQAEQDRMWVWHLCYLYILPLLICRTMRLYQPFLQVGYGIMNLLRTILVGIINTGNGTVDLQHSHHWSWVVFFDSNFINRCLVLIVCQETCFAFIHLELFDDWKKIWRQRN